MTGTGVALVTFHHPSRSQGREAPQQLGDVARTAVHRATCVAAGLSALTAARMPQPSGCPATALRVLAPRRITTTSGEPRHADVVEPVDTRDLKSRVRKSVRVRVPPSAPYLFARCRPPTHRAGSGSRKVLEPAPYLFARCRPPTHRAGSGSRKVLEPAPILSRFCSSCTACA